MLVTISAIVYPLLEQNDRDFAQSKGFRPGPENQTLIDVLEQQEARPGHPRTHNEPLADENGPRLWLRGPARGRRHGAGSRTSNLETPSAVPSASTYCASAV
jgi:hypothetical protein